jgi:N-acetylmuramoyl-L-alanine amidase
MNNRLQNSVTIILVFVLSVMILSACSGNDSDKTENERIIDESIEFTTSNGIAPIITPDAIENRNDEIDIKSQSTVAAITKSAFDNLPLNGVIIGIDAGHQLHGNNSKESVAPDSSETKPMVTSGTSGVVTNIPEHELNLAVAKKLQALLSDLGATVIMSRTNADIDISNKERAEMMNEANADLVVRIHANGGKSSEKGAMVLVPDGHIPKSVENISKEAGEIILDSFIAETGANNIGVIPRKDMTGFNWSKVPVCLIEMGYMTNPQEDKLLSTDEYKEKCALGIANGIVKWHKEREK